MAADYSQKIRNPENPNGPLVDVVFPADLTARLYKYSRVAFENLRAAKFVLEEPKRIFFGIREHNEGGGWCYTGRPATWCICVKGAEPDLENPVFQDFPPRLVFAVYVSPRMRVYECRAERIAADDPSAPEGWRNRYRGLLWKSTS